MPSHFLARETNHGFPGAFYYSRQTLEIFYLYFIKISSLSVYAVHQNQELILI